MYGLGFRGLRPLRSWFKIVVGAKKTGDRWGYQA